jgi:hypothetical protein
MGEFMRSAGTAVAGAVYAKNAYTSTSKALSAIGKTGKENLQAAGRKFYGLDAMSRGVSEAVKSEGDKRNWNKGQRLQNYVNGMAGLMWQNAENRIPTLLTGVENTNSSEKGISAFGKGNKEGEEGGTKGEQNFDRAKYGAKQGTLDRIQAIYGDTDTDKGGPVIIPSKPSDTGSPTNASSTLPPA